MFRFTIRDVLWVTALVAMGVAWWCERAGRDREWTTTNSYQTSRFVGDQVYWFHEEHREKRGALRFDRVMNPPSASRKPKP
jgi:hypothetical protein